MGTDNFLMAREMGNSMVGERKDERKRGGTQRDTDRHRETDTGRQLKGVTQTQKDRERHRNREIETQRETGRQKHRHRVRETEKQTQRGRNRHRDRETEI